LNRAKCRLTLTVSGVVHLIPSTAGTFVCTNLVHTFTVVSTRRYASYLLYLALVNV